MSWFRVPTWCIGRDHRDEAIVALWILGEWHVGREVSAAAVKAEFGWGWSRAAAMIGRLWTWAGAEGAARPDVALAPRNGSGTKSGSRRGVGGESAGSDDVDAAPIVNEDRGAAGESPGIDRGASRTRVLPVERDVDRQIKIEPLSATADPVPSPPEKRKPARKAKTGKEPHPCHQRVIDAWDRVWKKCVSGVTGAEPYVWAPRDVMILVTAVRDPYVSRDPAKADADMQRVGAAMTRYLSQEVDGRFVKGLSIKGFASDVARWFTPVDAATKIHNGRSPAPSMQDLVSAAQQLGGGTGQSPALSPSGRVVIDVTGVSS